MGTLMSSCWRQEGLRRPEENDSQGASFAPALSPSLSLSLTPPPPPHPFCEMTRVLLLCNILKICRFSLGVVPTLVMFYSLSDASGQEVQSECMFHFRQWQSLASCSILREISACGIKTNLPLPFLPDFAVPGSSPIQLHGHCATARQRPPPVPSTSSLQPSLRPSPTDSTAGVASIALIPNSSPHPDSDALAPLFRSLVRKTLSSICVLSLSLPLLEKDKKRTHKAFLARVILADVQLCHRLEAYLLFVSPGPNVGGEGEGEGERGGDRERERERERERGMERARERAREREMERARERARERERQREREREREGGERNGGGAKGK
jgi:hypothetical protein